MNRSESRPTATSRDEFVSLYDELADRIHPYLTAKLGSPADADDVLQETFVRLVRNRTALRSADDPTAFAFVVARNEANRWLDARRRRSETLAAATAQNLFAVSESHDQQAREAAEAAALALASLGEEDREIVVLKTYSGLTFREIGDILDRPLGTVADRYRNALNRMKFHLEKERR